MRLRYLLAALCLLATPALAQLALTGAGLGKPGSVAVTYMSTPLLSQGGGNNPSATAIQYASLVNGVGFSGTIANRLSVNSVAGTISKLAVSFPTVLTQGTYNIYLNQNGSAETLTCQITTGSTTCTDTSDIVTVSAGDLLAWEVCPSNVATCPAGSVPTTQTAGVQISAIFTSTVGQESPIYAGGNSNAISTAAQNYQGVGASVAPNATEINVSAVMPVAGTIDKLNVAIGTSPGGVTGWAFIVYKNGSPTGVGGGAVPATCVTTPTAVNCSCFITSTNKTCSDVSTAAVSFAAGDTISISSVPTASAPTSTSGAEYSLRWIPSTTNQAILFDEGAANPPTSGTRYMNLSGSTGAQSTEPPTYIIAPVLTTHMTLGNLIVAQSAAPQAAASRTLTLRGGSGSTAIQAPTFSVTPSTIMTIGGVVSTPAGEDTLDTYQPQTGYLLDLQTVPSGTQNALTWYKTGMSVTIP